MSLLPIAELKPELSDRESKQFRALVTLIWPYSSSQRQFALLLTEPDFRLRRKKGQVRARFHGSSARALATTGVGIGDEVVLSLRGAQFVQEDTVSTPGRSIDWELEYTQTVAVQVYRHGREIASIELANVAPTPTPQSPVRAIPAGTPSPAHQWSSPAFLKRMRLSDGPFFEAPYDPLADESGDGHDKKRRRKSYRDWKAWTYNARTPSPDKQDVEIEDELEEMDASPIRQSRLPRTPVSPVKQSPCMISDDIDKDQADGGVPAPQDSKKDFVRDDAYYDLYAGPDELPPSEAPYAFGGDTEVNTEDEDEDIPDTEGDSPSPTEVDTEDIDGSHTRSVDGSQDASSPREFGIEQPHHPQLVVAEPVEDGDNTSVMGMPPPTLSALNANFPAPSGSGLLTPIGKEPASPTLQPLDSATLPLPSPFPGEREGAASSYFDRIPSREPRADVEQLSDEEPKLPSDADYIMETSFFSSIGSSKTPAQHPDHETTFASVRFGFGMDGAGWSRPLPLSSPVPEEVPKHVDDVSLQIEEVPEDIVQHYKRQDVACTGLSLNDPEAISSSPDRGAKKATVEEASSPSVVSRGSTTEAVTSPTHEMTEPEVIELSSGSEAEDSDESEEEEKTTDSAVEVQNPQVDIPPNVRNEELVQYPDPESYVDVSTIPETIDIDSDSENDSVDAQSTQKVFGNDALRTPDPSREVRSFGLVDMPSDMEINTLGPSPLLSSFDLPPTPFAQGQVQQGFDAILSSFSEAQFPTVGENEPHLALEEMDVDAPNLFAQHTSIAGMKIESDNMEEHHPDIKVESVEEDAMEQPPNRQGRQRQEEPDRRKTRSPGKMLIDVPDEGDHVGELHTIAVSTTAPARNTRSKTKPSTSPSKEEAEGSERITRSTRSKASANSNNPTTQSLPRTRTRSTVSPSQEDLRLSPYSLRSQSKLLSPTKSTSFAATSPRETQNKDASQRSSNSIGEISHAQLVKDDPFTTNVVQQKLHTPANEDTSPDSLHPSTDKFIDDWNTFTNFSDPPAPDEPQGESFTLKPPPAGARALRKSPASKTEPTPSEAQETTPRKILKKLESSPTEQPTSSPSHRRLRSAGSTGSVEAASPSPRIVRTTRRRIYSSSVEPSQDHSAEKPQQTTLQDQSESSALRSSPPGEITTSLSHNRHSMLDSNLPMTPEATQKMEDSQDTTAISPPQRQTLPMTPQLTQATSGLRSFEDRSETRAISSKAASRSPKITKTTPRRNATQIDVASPLSSREASPNESSDAEQLATQTAAADKVPTPTIGLSTPLAYYTPLNSIAYFLNRSSQFHTASNPDILALVTSPTTTPQRATKGPKHWTTTLHITDATIWPATTTVACFRAYQNALPGADAGDVILLRAMGVKSLNRQPMLVSADESAWCVWRYGKPLWGKKRGAFGEIRAREEVRGPQVERGEGEWREVEMVREWYTGSVKEELEGVEEGKVKTRSRDRKEEKEERGEESAVRGRLTRSRDKGRAADGEEV